MKEMKGVAPVAIAAVIIVAVIAAAAAYLYLTPPEEEEEIATVRFWHVYSPHEENVVRALLDEFEAEHPDIKVTMEMLPYDELRTKLITSTAAGMPPDIVRMDILWMPEFAEMGALLELENYMAETGISTGDFYPGPLSTCMWKGKLYGLPLNTDTRVLGYRKSLLEAAGVSVPTTWDEFLDACKKLTLDKDDDGIIDQWGFDIGWTATWHFNPWLWQAGGAELNSEMTKAVINEGPGVTALQFLVDMIYVHEVMPAPPGDPWGRLARGEVGMIVSGPWIKGIVEGADPAAWEDTGLAVLPKGVEEASIIGGADLAIFVQTDYPDEAWAVVQYMASKYFQLEMAKIGVMATLKAAGEDPVVAGDPFWSVFADQMLTARSRAVHPEYGKMQDTAYGYLEAALLGEMTPKDALDAIAAEWDKLL